MPDPFFSTFSIAAYDPAESAWGVAVASKYLAVGAVVPWAQVNAGAVATQSYVNPTYGSLGLEMMASGLSASETLKYLLAQDPQSERRQVGMVNREGQAATFTGGGCHPWAGGITGDGATIQGNMLTGPEVISEMQAAFSQTKGDLPTRLYNSLRAGDFAGGDRRGRQSAAILVVKPGGHTSGLSDYWIDYRVDDHPNPVQRLGELLELHQVFREEINTQEKVRLSGENLRQLQDRMAQCGFYSNEINGQNDAATQRALRDFLSTENLLDRADIDAGWITRPAFEFLLRSKDPDR